MPGVGIGCCGLHAAVYGLHVEGMYGNSMNGMNGMNGNSMSGMTGMNGNSINGNGTKRQRHERQRTA